MNGSSLTHVTLLPEQRAVRAQGAKSTLTKVEVLPAAKLTADHLAAWKSLLPNSGPVSPYLMPEFTQAVAAVRSDAMVGLFRDQSGDLVGLLPFQTDGKGRGEPAGGRLNDVQRILFRPDFSPRQIQATELLSQIGLNTYSFHSAPSKAPLFRQAQFCELDSHYLDLSVGWKSYLGWAEKNSSTIRRHGQKRRALERDLGPIRFEFHTLDRSVLDQLVAWKRRKYQRTKTFDILSVDWTVDLLREIHQAEHRSFQGLLSALWAGDQLVAAHMGMLTPSVLHYWFPVFDPQFAKYSPGTELLLNVTREACEQGVERLDLGYGDDPYKFRFANAHEKMSCGLVTSNSWHFRIAKAKYFARQSLKQIPLKGTVKRVLRAIYPGFGGWNFR